MTAPSAPGPQARALAAPVLLAVLGGGAVGTLLRVGVGAALPHAADAFATSTLIVNVVGSLLLGAAVAGLWVRLPDWGRAGLGAGLLGSFTTFSALTDSLWLLVEAREPVLALVTAVAHVSMGVAAAVAGLEIGARLARRRPPPLGDGSDE